MSNTLYGGIEVGGTKFICGVGSGAGELLLTKEIPTTTPDDTLRKVVDFFREHQEISAIGIGSFGPISLNEQSDNYGQIINSPKQDWSGTNIYQAIAGALQKPTKLATDTDVAAIGEHYHGIGLGINNLVFLTVGTGIGGSIFANGKLFHGGSHPEMGHIRIPMGKDAGNGVCPYHNDCLEGLASGTSLEKRTGKPAASITDEIVWQEEAHYIGLGLVNILMATQPERIIVGGGVLRHPGLIDLIRNEVNNLVNGYLVLPQLESYIVQASSESIGVLGAVKLASL
jgi:fructokinase